MLFGCDQVVDMEKALDASAGATPARSIVEGLADKFTYVFLCFVSYSHHLNVSDCAWRQLLTWKEMYVSSFLIVCIVSCFDHSWHVTAFFVEVY